MTTETKFTKTDGEGWCRKTETKAGERMRILTANLQAALHWAIHSLAESETKTFGPDYKSGLRAGWEEVLKAIERGENIEVSDK